MVEFFDNAYRDGGRPTWDIGRPQGALVRLAGSGLIVGSVLDAGCGTGENALYLAARGHPVLGVDVAAAAIERARAKVADRDLPAEFLRRRRAGPRGTGPGVRHGPRRRASSTPSATPNVRATRPASARHFGRGGRAFLLCWSDRNPFGRGPRRVSPGEIRETFRGGWGVEAIDPEWLETRLPDGRIHAWLARIVRTGTGT